MSARADIFAAIRKHARKGVFSAPENIAALDALLDRFGVPGAAVAAPAPVSHGTPFDRALAIILRHEGGFVNHPRDPGGMTNLGVTKATWEAWTGKPATEMDMRALTKDKVAPLYRKNYWEKAGCDRLPPGLALCVFDFAVNAGPARAVRYLQKMAGAAADGVFGDKTQRTTQQFVGSVGEDEAVRRYQESRRFYYKQLRTYPVFGRGWLRRVNEVEQEALEL